MQRLLGLALGALGALQMGACYSAGGSDEDGAAAGASGSTSGGGSTSLGGATTGGSGGGAYECTTVFASIDKACTTADDCVLVNHTADCCGTILIMGINTGALQPFSEAEAYCSAQLPACGCAARGMNLEDGTLIDFADTNYAVECSAGQCGSVHGGVTFPCLEATCTASQYCQTLSGGPAGSGTTGTCFPLGDCSDCACINAAGCDCSETEGNITVSCAAP